MFKVQVSLLIGRDPVGPVRITEEYTTWRLADKAFEHWSALKKMHNRPGTDNSVVADVELIEESARKVHRRATNEERQPDNNVVNLGISDHVNSCPRI